MKYLLPTLTTLAWVLVVLSAHSLPSQSLWLCFAGLSILTGETLAQGLSRRHKPWVVPMAVFTTFNADPDRDCEQTESTWPLYLVVAGGAAIMYFAMLFQGVSV